MATLYLPEAATLSRYVNDVPHRLAVVFLAHEAPESTNPAVVLTAGWAVALVEVGGGRVLAWDGWYTADLDEQNLPVDGLRDVDWTDWDNLASKLLVKHTRPWLAGPVLDWLVPTFSLAREAASLFVSHFDTEDPSSDLRVFRDASLVAYLPLLDEDALVAEVGRIEERLSVRNIGARAAIATTLRALDAEGTTADES